MSGTTTVVAASSRADPRAKRAVLHDAVELFVRESIPFVAIGSIAGSMHAGLDWEHQSEDIDFLVYRSDTERILPALHLKGYEIPEPQLGWLRKAIKGGVQVDLIFELTGDIHLDPDMLARAVLAEVGGILVPIMPAEDYAISQAISASPETPEHWFNAAETLKRSNIDPEIFARRSSWNPDRARALALFARSF